MLIRVCKTICNLTALQYNILIFLNKERNCWYTTPCPEWFISWSCHVTTYGFANRCLQRKSNSCSQPTVSCAGTEPCSWRNALAGVGICSMCSWRGCLHRGHVSKGRGDCIAEETKPGLDPLSSSCCSKEFHGSQCYYGCVLWGTAAPLLYREMVLSNVCQVACYLPLDNACPFQHALTCPLQILYQGEDQHF